VCVGVEVLQFHYYQQAGPHRKKEGRKGKQLGQGKVVQENKIRSPGMDLGHKNNRIGS